MVVLVDVCEVLGVATAADGGYGLNGRFAARFANFFFEDRLRNVGGVLSGRGRKAGGDRGVSGLLLRWGFRGIRGSCFLAKLLADGLFWNDGEAGWWERPAV